MIALLLKTPILQDFSEESENESLNARLDFSIIDDYIKNHKTDKGILLIRRYYGITAYK